MRFLALGQGVNFERFGWTVRSHSCTCRAAQSCPRMEKFDRNDPERKRRIQELIVGLGGGNNEDLVADIIENALKMLVDVESRGDARVIQTAVRELRYAFRLFAPHASVRKVTMFGSA